MTIAEWLLLGAVVVVGALLVMAVLDCMNPRRKHDGYLSGLVDGLWLSWLLDDHDDFGGDE